MNIIFRTPTIPTTRTNNRSRKNREAWQAASDQRRRGPHAMPSRDAVRLFEGLRLRDRYDMTPDDSADF
jgi:hypothetical protein